MSRQSNISDRPELSLRRDAEDRLRAGAAPSTRGLPLDQQALTLLYTMASDPGRSSEALRLLQELQVHQVELDLQWEELENNEREMCRELGYYKALFELSPTACLVVTMDGRIIEANPAMVSLLALRQDELPGQSLQDFLTPESREPWIALLAKIQTGDPAADCEVRVGSGGNTVALRLSAKPAPEGDAVLLAGISC